MQAFPILKSKVDMGLYLKSKREDFSVYRRKVSHSSKKVSSVEDRRTVLKKWRNVNFFQEMGNVTKGKGNSWVSL